jgi:anti-anti-sigma factor
MVMIINDPDFTLETHDRLTYFLVKISGKFTVKNLFEVKKAITNIMEMSIKNIVVDLEHCSEMDSSSLGLLSNVLKKLKQRNGILGLMNPGGDILNLLQETGLTSIAPLYTSIEDLDLEFE